MPTFRELVNEQGVSLMSADAPEQKVADISPFAVLAERNLNIDNEALKLKSADEELTEDEVEYVHRLAVAARSVDSGRGAFTSSVGRMIEIRNTATTSSATYVGAADSFYSKTTAFTSYTDPDA